MRDPKGDILRTRHRIAVDARVVTLAKQVLETRERLDALERALLAERVLQNALGGPLGGHK